MGLCNSGNGTPLPADLHDALAELVGRIGEKSAVQQLGIPRNTLSRCLAGMSVRAGTVALVRAALSKASQP